MRGRCEFALSTIRLGVIDVRSQTREQVRRDKSPRWRNAHSLHINFVSHRRHAPCRRRSRAARDFYRRRVDRDADSCSNDLINLIGHFGSPLRTRIISFRGHYGCSLPCSTVIGYGSNVPTVLALVPWLRTVWFPMSACCRRRGRPLIPSYGRFGYQSGHQT